MSKDSDQPAGSGGSESSTKPYLLRAIYQWAVDNNLTPQILVSVFSPEVIVPMQHVKDDQIVLNIHPQSVKDIQMGNEYLLFSARFSGNPFELSVPVAAIMAIYARENGQGIVFQSDGSGVTPPPIPGGANKKAVEKKESKNSEGKTTTASHLKLVK